jgi:hypothetical protein
MDAYVRNLQHQIERNLEELIEALKPGAGGGGGGGGGGGKPPKVGLKAQLMLLRSMQKNLEERTAAVRAKYGDRSPDELDWPDKEIVDRLLLEQEDIRRLTLKLAEVLK